MGGQLISLEGKAAGKTKSFECDMTRLCLSFKV